MASITGRNTDDTDHRLTWLQDRNIEAVRTWDADDVAFGTVNTPLLPHLRGIYASIGPRYEETSLPRSPIGFAASRFLFPLMLRRLFPLTFQPFSVLVASYPPPCVNGL